jgi:uncharacterized protein YprB with RNaseH-like and TPR domain
MTTTDEDIYLDVETDWGRRLTVVGFFAATTGLVQLVGREITPEAVRQALPAAGTLYTYNGHCFDLTCLRKQLGLDLRACFASVDLRWVCQRRGLRGGQKAIEKRLGHRRQLPDLDGRGALLLWTRYQRGDHAALATLLKYNSEDLHGMMAIRRHLDLLSPLPLGERGQSNGTVGRRFN